MTFDLPELRTLSEQIATLDPYDPWQKSAKGLHRNLRRIAAELKRGDITPQQWRNKMDSVIRVGHVEAHMAGQKMAGAQAYGVEASRVGRLLADQESQYLQGFLQDILDGRYTDLDGEFKEGAFNARQMMYVNKTRGTAYDGFVYASPGNQFDWVLGAVEDHCEDCPTLAAGGPYDVSTLYTYPGSADTPCLVNCVVDGMARVETLRGMVPIADLTDADYVRTHTGAFRRVVVAWSWVTEKALKSYRAVQKDGRSVRFTEGHRLLGENGWEYTENLQCNKLQVYTMNHAKGMREVFQDDAIRPFDRSLQGLRFDLSLRSAEGFSGERVYQLRAPSKRIEAMAHAGATIKETRWAEICRANSAREVLRPFIGEFHNDKGGWAKVREVLDRTRDAKIYLPLPLGMGAGERPDSKGHGDTPHQRRQFGRQIGESSAFDEPGTSEGSRINRARAEDGGGERPQSHRDSVLDVLKLRDDIRRVPEGNRADAKVLLEGVCGPGTRLYDIQVEGDESFVIEGIVSHNCKCFLRRDDGVIGPMPFGVQP